MLAVAEAARNVACTGAEPIGATNNLNFGNPERPEIMWQFGEAVRGIGDACRAFEVPITGGNVSLYNETEGRAIYPTPVLGVVGLIEDASTDRQPDVQAGRRGGASCWAIIEVSWAAANTWRVCMAWCRAAAGARPGARAGAAASDRSADWRGLLQSAHDCAEGGLAVTRGGVHVRLAAASGYRSTCLRRRPAGDSRPRPPCLASRPRGSWSRWPEHLDAVLEPPQAAGVPCQVIGETGGEHITVCGGGRCSRRDAGRGGGISVATVIERTMVAAEQ